MEFEIEKAYFRMLRMIYCSELQLISFLPELWEQTAGFELASSVEVQLHLCRDRRNALERIAAEHGSSVAGDDCHTMRQLVSKGRRQLRHHGRGPTRDETAVDICLSVHRLLVLNYKIARHLAAGLGLSADTARLGQLADRIVEHLPRACDSAGPTGPKSRLASALS